MPRKDSQEHANDDAEKFLLRIFWDIPTVVSQVCASLDYHPDWMEFECLVQRIILLLIDDDYYVLRSFDHRSEPQTWLYTIAQRYILRRLRGQGRVMSLDDAPPGSFTVQPDLEERLLSKERDEILEAAVSKLTEHERKLYGLWLQERSVEEMAKEIQSLPEIWLPSLSGERFTSGGISCRYSRISSQRAHGW